MLVAPPVAGYSERVYQVFGKETLDQLIPVARRAAAGARRPAAAAAVAAQQKKTMKNARRAPAMPGEMRLHGFVSKPEIQKLNRNSIFIFVNGRLIRDRLVQHALTEAYRNIIPPTVYPVVLLFLEMPAGEVDVNVHPSKTEVRFRQSTRDARFRARLGARRADEGAPRAAVHHRDSRPRHRQLRPDPGRKRVGAALRSGRASDAPARPLYRAWRQDSRCKPRYAPPISARFQFEGGIAVEANAAIPVARGSRRLASQKRFPRRFQTTAALPRSTRQRRRCQRWPRSPRSSRWGKFAIRLSSPSMKMDYGSSTSTWPTSACCSSESCKQRAAQKVESQRLLMPIVLELSPAQQAVFAEIADELKHNGFEAEPFGARSVAVKVAPAGVDAARSSTCCTNCSIRSRAKSSR